MWQRLKQWRWRRIVRAHPLDETTWQRAFARLPLLYRLSVDEQHRLRELVILFLQAKEFEPADGFTITDDMRYVVAMQACLLILNLDIDWYSEWYAVIIYPDAFAPKHEEMDEDGVVHMDEDWKTGESWSHGPVILSWRDSQLSGSLDGYNVVIHEFAHKLDMLNGDANGFPPLHRDMRVSDWTDAFTDAYEHFLDDIDHDRETVFDRYGGESPGEFFAVASELFFEQPQRVFDAYPDLYRQLSLFYRQNPLG